MRIVCILRNTSAALALAALMISAGCDSDDEGRPGSRENSNEEPKAGSGGSKDGGKAGAGGSNDSSEAGSGGSEDTSKADAGSEAESDSGSGDDTDSSADAGPADASPGEEPGPTEEPGPSGEPSPDAGSSEEPPVEDTAEHTYVTTTVVFNPEGDTTYLSLLPKLEGVSIELGNAREFASWASAWASDGKLFITDGESPTVKRFSVDDKRNLKEEGAVSFLNFGVEYADSKILSSGKAYLFNVDEAVVWDPTAMEITGSFMLPAPAPKAGGLEFDGLDTGRSFVTRGNRAFVAAGWMNWDDYTAASESVIVVIDTDNDKILKSITVPCPYLDVATSTEDGTLYFSNWVYSAAQTLVQGTKKACAVRILPGQEEIDPSWTLTFADVTDGREGAALQYIGGNKAVFSVFHHERVEDLEEQADFNELGNSSNWRLWLLDLNTRDAKLIDGIDWNAGGIATQVVDGRSFVLLPTDEYDATTVYEVRTDGSVEPRWTTPGWSMTLFKLR